MKSAPFLLLSSVVLIGGGAALAVCAIADVFGLSEGIDLDLGFLQLSKWPAERWGILALGAFVGMLGLGMLTAAVNNKNS
ncbi:MAG: hypothetical protein IT462_16600 [Planctomycetes bacterium]|nr:hypothetical protein [Planctomycetota bacterium]